eukprot:13573506-Alexandrium_andersonii.AAC.1
MTGNRPTSNPTRNVAQAQGNYQAPRLRPTSSQQLTNIWTRRHASQGIAALRNNRRGEGRNASSLKASA